MLKLAAIKSNHLFYFNSYGLPPRDDAVLEIARKKSLARNLGRMAAAFPRHYDFSPRTFLLPEQVGRAGWGLARIALGCTGRPCKQALASTLCLIPLCQTLIPAEYPLSSARLQLEPFLAELGGRGGSRSGGAGARGPRTFIMKLDNGSQVCCWLANLWGGVQGGQGAWASWLLLGGSGLGWVAAGRQNMGRQWGLYGQGSLAHPPAQSMFAGKSMASAHPLACSYRTHVP